MHPCQLVVHVQQGTDTPTAAAEQRWEVSRRSHLEVESSQITGDRQDCRSLHSEERERVHE